MSTRIAETLNARLLTVVAVVAVALFVLSGIIASAWGREPESSVIDALGSISWFGFLISALLLIVLTVASLVARSVSGARTQGS